MNPIELVGIVAFIGLLCSSTLFLVGYVRALLRNSWWEPCDFLRWGALFMIATIDFVMISVVIFPREMKIKRTDALGQIFWSVIVSIFVFWWWKRWNRNR